MASASSGRARRSDYPHLLAITTRWADNDAYGHVNNTVYYGYFDTVVNEFLVRGGVLDIAAGRQIGLVRETRCVYHAPVSFPERVTAGLRVARIGNSSVTYEIAIFREDDEDAAAEGHFVHVYVDRETRRPAPLDPALRALLETVAG